MRFWLETIDCHVSRGGRKSHFNAVDLWCKLYLAAKARPVESSEKCEKGKKKFVVIGQKKKSMRAGGQER
jgi:hypothetical protein